MDTAIRPRIRWTKEEGQNLTVEVWKDGRRLHSEPMPNTRHADSAARKAAVKFKGFVTGSQCSKVQLNVVRNGATVYSVPDLAAYLR